MNWYSDPPQHNPLPPRTPRFSQFAAIPYGYSNDEPHATNFPNVVPPQYTPLPFASSSNFPHPWPPAHIHGIAQPYMVNEIESIPPPLSRTRYMEEPNVQKRKRHEASGLDSTAEENRMRQARAHIKQYRPNHDPSYQTATTTPTDYDVSGRYYPFSPFDQQTARPAASSYTTTGQISLPGAALYKQQQLGNTPPPLPDPAGAAEAAPARIRVVTARTATPIPSEDRRHQALTSLPERDVSRHQYPGTRDQPLGSLVVPMGSQHNPLEIESSPESAKAAKSSKRKKKKFYAVTVGRVPGIYDDWDEVERQTTKFKGAKQQGFPTWEEAEAFFEVNMRTTKLQYDYRNDSMKRPEMPAAAQQTPNYPADFEYKPPPHTEQAAASPRVPVTSAEPEPFLKAEQQKVVDLILQGHNVFYTGSAGCGKSTILKAFVKQLQLRGKRVKIVAPTNLAALNVGGVTTWSYAGWTPDSMKKPLDKLMQAAHGKEIWERFDATDVLVIDEISMVENLLFERLNHVMKASRGERYGGGPFGGVQVIVTGDFCQLSPVKPFQYCIGCGWELERDHPRNPKEYRCENKYCREDVFYDIDKWAFRSKAWEECEFKHINLTEIHRQSDKKFISILQRIRTDGVILKPHAHILLNHTSETEDAIKLFARRDDVDRINNENIHRLPSTVIVYKCVDHFDFKEHHKTDTSLEKNTRQGDNGTLVALKDHRYEVFVQLKQGMRIVLQANLDPAAGLVNGSQGFITDFEPFDDKKLPRKPENREAGASGMAVTRGTYAKYNEDQIKIFGKENKRQPWPIVKFDNGLTRTIFADCTVNELGNEEPYSLLSRTQIPLMAGYAITVHKSQGMTLDRVIVDLSRAFEPSQIYVALSRARSLKGLKVIGLPRMNLGGANEQVKEFFEKYLKNS